MYMRVAVSASQTVTKKIVYHLVGLAKFVLSLSPRFRNSISFFRHSHADGWVHLVGQCAGRWSRSVCSLTLCRANHFTVVVLHFRGRNRTLHSDSLSPPSPTTTSLTFSIALCSWSWFVWAFHGTNLCSIVLSYLQAKQTKWSLN
jgi:hypothetical protein